MKKVKLKQQEKVKAKMLINGRRKIALEACGLLGRPILGLVAGEPCILVCPLSSEVVAHRHRRPSGRFQRRRDPNGMLKKRIFFGHFASAMMNGHKRQAS